MKSSSGEHFIALDHVRALAIFMVVAWHFIHAGGGGGYPVRFEGAPSVFPLALLDEGHTGVALFMTLSGYLFAKLLDGKIINYKAFLWNRFLRLFPLLTIILLIVGVENYLNGESMQLYARTIAKGVAVPALPNGAWSITVEFHYYLMLPLFLWMFRKSKFLPLSIVVAAIFLRLLIYQEVGQVQSFAYKTIVGRIDQFTLGMVLFQVRAYFAHRHVLVSGLLTTFALFYWYFDLHGGFYLNPSYPSPSPIWIFLPTIEGMAYAIGIAWYDSSFSPSNAGMSKFIGRIGVYSYSIYLLHSFVASRLARYVNEQVMDISNFYVACIWSVVFFLFMIPVGYFSFRFIEAPFLKLRRRYTISRHKSSEIPSTSLAAGVVVPVGEAHLQ